MEELVASKNVVDELVDIHRRLKMAMDALITHARYDEAERILKMVDLRMTDLVNQTRVVTRGP